MTVHEISNRGPVAPQPDSPDATAQGAAEYSATPFEIAETLIDVAQFLAEMGDRQGALRYLDNALKAADDQPDIRSRVADCYISLGLLGIAYNLCQHTLDSSPFHRDSLVNLCRCAATLGRNDEAIGHLQRYSQMYPNDQEIRTLLVQRLAERIVSGVPAPRTSRSSGSFSISSFSDLEIDDRRKKQRGDYWFKKHLAEALEEYGWQVDDEEPDVLLYLFGLPPAQLKQARHKAVWIQSHPGLVSKAMLANFDEVYCQSPVFLDELRRQGRQAELLVGGTSKGRCQGKLIHDLVFVGNSWGDRGRRIINDLQGTGFKLEVWGEGWSGRIPERQHAGTYYPNEKLAQLYSSALVSLNDHRDDMLRWGFTSPRIFDIMASGGLVISDNVRGHELIFEDALVTYESRADLHEKIEFYLRHDEQRAAMIERGLRVVEQYTFRKVAEFLSNRFCDALRPKNQR